MKLEEIRRLYGGAPPAEAYFKRAGDVDTNAASIYVAINRSLVDKLLDVAQAAKACAFYYGGDVHSGPARMAVDSIAALESEP